jgi:hypothetical protein
VYGRSTDQAGIIAAELMRFDERTGFVSFQSLGSAPVFGRQRRRSLLIDSLAAQADELHGLMLSRLVNQPELHRFDEAFLSEDWSVFESPTGIATSSARRSHLPDRRNNSRVQHSEASLSLAVSVDRKQARSAHLPEASSS